MTEIQWSAWVDRPGPAAIRKLSLMWRWVGAGVFLQHELYLITLHDPSHGLESQPCFVVPCQGCDQNWGEMIGDGWCLYSWIAYIVNLLKILTTVIWRSSMLCFIAGGSRLTLTKGTMFWVFFLRKKPLQSHGKSFLYAWHYFWALLLVVLVFSFLFPLFVVCSKT